MFIGRLSQNPAQRNIIGGMPHTQIVQLRALQLFRVYKKPLLGGRIAKRETVFCQSFRVRDIVGLGDRQKRSVFLYGHHKFGKESGTGRIII